MNALKVVDEHSNSYEAIHERAMRAAANYRRSEIEMLDAIADVESRQIYYQMKIKDLFQYCTEMLNLSRHATYNFINVMKKGKEVPALLEAIRDGSTTVSKARKICSVIDEENAKDWIGLTRECSSRIVERAVAMANPRAAVFESLKYVSGDTLELKFAVSEEWSVLLGDVKDLMSQKSRKAVTTEEALFNLMKDYKRKHDPVLKAARSENKAALRGTEHAASCADNKEVPGAAQNHDSRAENVLGSFETERNKSVVTVSSADNINLTRSAISNGRYVPARVRHKVALRDNGKCTFVDRHGKRCGSGRWVQRHHVHHFADGGSHEVENLETLCWAHHVMTHR